MSFNVLGRLIRHFIHFVVCRISNEDGFDPRREDGSKEKKGEKEAMS